MPNKNLKRKKQLPVRKYNFNPKLLLQLIVLIFVVLILYYQSFNAEFLNWDDNDVIVNNYTIRSLSLENIGHIFSSTNLNSYNPLVILSYAIEYNFTKLSPSLYHIDNVIIHIINSLLVYWFIFLICSDRIVSFFTALLFAIFPLHVEAVTWVTSRKDLLFTLFFISSIILYIYYLKKDKNISIYIVSIFLFLLSALSKPVAVTLPAVLILVDYFISSKFEIKKQFDKIPYFIISLTFIYITISTFSGNIGSASHFSFEYPLIFFYSIFFYLYKFFLPVGLSPIYPDPANGMLYLSLIITFVIIGGLVYYIIKKEKIKEEIIFASCFFLLTILPYVNLIPVKNISLVFDRFTYLPYTGLFFILTFLIYNLFKKSKNNKIIMFIPLLIISALFILSYQRASAWHNSVSLWSDAVENYPELPELYSKRSEAYVNQGNLLSSINDLNKAISLDPKNSKYYDERGNSYLSSNNHENALKDFQKAINYDSANYTAFNNTGILFSYEKKYDEALNAFNKALSIKPDYANACMNIGNLYLQKQVYDSALMAYGEAIKLEPLNPFNFISRGSTFLKINDYKEAIIDFKNAIKIDPDFENAYERLAYTYMLMKDYNSSWEVIYRMKARGINIDRQILQKLQKESGRNY